jgi:hypothetical protein
MKNLLSLIFLLSLLPAHHFTALAQRYILQGNVKMGTDTTALPGATVVLQQVPGRPAGLGKNTTLVGTATDQQGNFRLEGVAPGQYSLKVSYLGFTPYSRSVKVLKSVNLGTIHLQEEATTLVNCSNHA